MRFHILSLLLIFSAGALACANHPKPDQAATTEPEKELPFSVVEADAEERSGSYIRGNVGGFSKSFFSPKEKNNRYQGPRRRRKSDRPNRNYQ